MRHNKTALFTYKCIKLDADKTPKSYQIAVFTFLTLGLLSFASSAAATILSVFDNPIRQLSKDDAIKNLGDNAKTNWLVRLIPYSYTNERTLLSVESIKTLGPPQLQYVFVAPYEELRGYKVSDAVEMVDGTVDHTADQRVTAIIFRTKQKHIFPANARGVLQVLRIVEKNKISDPKSKLNIDDLLGAEKYEGDRKLLDEIEDINSWSWQNYSESYETFCRLAQKFRCNKSLEAHNYIGSFNDDWHPLGFAQMNKNNYCKDVKGVCGLKSKEWENVTKSVRKNFGARVFLVDNFDVNSLGSRYLIDFDKPDEQVIPDIGSAK